MQLSTFNWLLLAALGLGLGLVLIVSLQDPFAIVAIGVGAITYFGWTLSLAGAISVYLFNSKRHAKGWGIAMGIITFILMLPIGGLVMLALYALWLHFFG